MTEDRVETRVEALRPALERLDGLLRRAISAAAEGWQRSPAQSYPGLCVTDEEVERLLAREPLRPTLWRSPDEGTPPLEAPALSLKERLGLGDFELDLVLLALAPELDLKYERLFAYLNDDLTKKRPTVDLALGVLCASPAERLEALGHFEPEGLLFASGALRLRPQDGAEGGLLARELRLDPILTRYLTGQSGPDERLRGCCTETYPSWTLTELPVAASAVDLLCGALKRARSGERVRIRLQGAEGCGQQACAEGLAAGLGMPLLVADLRGLAEGEGPSVLGLVLLHARLFDRVPYIRWDGPGADLRTTVLLANQPGVLVLDGLADADGLAGTWVRVELDRPGWERRRAYWERQLAVVGADLGQLGGELGLDTIAARFELTFPEIRAAVSDAASTARVLGRGPTAAELMDAARRHSGRALESLAEVMSPARRWSDLVLPAEVMGQLRDLCDRVRRRHRVLESWGFGREVRGTGANALFVGASGTGKTLAAEVIAGELGLNLYRIDLATVVSKYIGETEKNLDRVFRAAERSNAVLLFDEADALFGKRSIVRDAHDRYANVEIAYLLQRLESYPGVSILTTNLSDNLDQAFTRRLAFTVHFPFPGPAERRRIWEAVWPPEAPLDAGLELRWLAERFKLTGGNIRNVALAAACLVADGGSIGMVQVLQALRREYQKMGKALADRELEPPGEPLRAVAS